ncbi:uncharacterized protein IWZ02DRAFT_499972 [Phyllosticta citriasiana]|uniref:Uncharacterized protein n=1 Tax=Phyllosticta citriasiana TaxID=595635 RepID=A0ABR1KJL2_9PEZI
MQPTLLTVTGIAATITSTTTQMSFLQGSQLPTLVPKYPTVNGTAMPTLVPTVSSIELPDSMKSFTSTYDFKQLSSLFPSIDWSSLPTYSMVSGGSSLTSLTEDLPLTQDLPTQVTSIDGLPSSFITEVPHFTVSGGQGVVFDPPVIEYDPEKPLDEIIVNIKGHLNCTDKCTEAARPKDSPADGSIWSVPVPVNITVTTTGPCSTAPQPTKFCHPEHCHNGHCHEKHCHKQSEIDELQKIDPDWIWSPKSNDEDYRGADDFSPLTVITLSGLPTATFLTIPRNITRTVGTEPKVGECDPRGHHHHHQSNSGHTDHHHHNSQDRTLSTRSRRSSSDEVTSTDSIDSSPLNMATLVLPTATTFQRVRHELANEELEANSDREEILGHPSRPTINRPTPTTIQRMTRRRSLAAGGPIDSSLLSYLSSAVESIISTTSPTPTSGSSSTSSGPIAITVTLTKRATEAEAAEATKAKAEAELTFSKTTTKTITWLNRAWVTNAIEDLLTRKPTLERFETDTETETETDDEKRKMMFKRGKAKKTKTTITSSETYDGHYLETVHVHKDGEVHINDRRRRSVRLGGWATATATATAWRK